MPATQVAGIFVMGFVRGKLSRLKAALVGYTDGSVTQSLGDVRERSHVAVRPAVGVDRQ